MAAVKVVTDPDRLAELLARLSKAPRIACDTEAASFHRYRDRVFLIQLSSDSENAIIDPLAIEDLSSVGALLADPAIEVVFHDADFDLRSLDRDYRFGVRNIFDTRIAAQLLGEPAIGLGPLLGKYFKIKVDKKYQRADWSKRPLDPEMLDYAAGDTSHLLGLRDELERQLDRLGRLEWAVDEFRRLEGIRWTGDTDGEENFLRVKGAKRLNAAALGILKAAYEWREAEAEAQDRPPFKILSNQALLALATKAPDTQNALLEAGVPAGSIKRYGPRLIRSVVKGTASPYLLKRKPGRRKKQPVAADGTVERLKVVRNRSASRLGIEPGVLCPNGTLQAIARAAPRDARDLQGIAELRGWQIEAMGTEAILTAVR